MQVTWQPYKVGVVTLTLHMRKQDHGLNILSKVLKTTNGKRSRAPVPAMNWRSLPPSAHVERHRLRKPIAPRFPATPSPVSRLLQAKIQTILISLTLWNTQPLPAYCSCLKVIKQLSLKKIYNLEFSLSYIDHPTHRSAWINESYYPFNMVRLLCQKKRAWKQKSGLLAGCVFMYVCVPYLFILLGPSLPLIA